MDWGQKRVKEGRGTLLKAVGPFWKKAKMNTSIVWAGGTKDGAGVRGLGGGGIGVTKKYIGGTNSLKETSGRFENGFLNSMGIKTCQL